MEFLFDFYVAFPGLNLINAAAVHLKRWFNLFCNFDGLREALLDIDVIDFESGREHDVQVLFRAEGYLIFVLV